MRQEQELVPLPNSTRLNLLLHNSISQRITHSMAFVFKLERGGCFRGTGELESDGLS